MKPKLSFPAGRANENSVLLRPCVRPPKRTTESLKKYFSRARRRTHEPPQKIFLRTRRPRATARARPGGPERTLSTPARPAGGRTTTHNLRLRAPKSERNDMIMPTPYVLAARTHGHNRSLSCCVQFFIFCLSSGLKQISEKLYRTRSPPLRLPNLDPKRI